jgi:hypothetical protein
MKKLISIGLALAGLSGAAMAAPALAAGSSYGTGTGIGTGIASARSSSASRSRSSSNLRSTNVATNGTSIQSYSTIAGQAPAVFAPGLAAAGIESCNGSVSLGGSAIGGGGALGFPFQDGPCNKRLNARTLWAFGQHEAALQTLCLDDELAVAMVASGIRCRVGRYAPTPAQQPSGAPVGEITDRKGRRYTVAACGSRGAVRTTTPGLCARRIASN